MSNFFFSAFFSELALFTAKTVIIFFIIASLLILFFALIAKGKEKMHGKLRIKNLNKKACETTELLLTETLSKKQLKKYYKEKKALDKAKNKKDSVKNIYVLNFNGDIKASAVETLREEITALLPIAKPTDEILVRLESPGGSVHGYGLAAAQLMRIRAQHIPLRIAIDKVAASGGYLMACIADTIYSAPFAIIGSIGVIVQLPNFHRYLKQKQIDFEQHTAGEFKRTISVFGENNEEGREKLQEEIEHIHTMFKNLISKHRPQVDILQVATGEYWLGQEALTLKLVDEIKTSDDYLFEQSKQANLYEVSYAIKKSFLSKLSASASRMQGKLLSRLMI